MCGSVVLQTKHHLDGMIHYDSVHSSTVYMKQQLGKWAESLSNCIAGKFYVMVRYINATFCTWGFNCILSACLCVHNFHLSATM